MADDIFDGYNPNVRPVMSVGDAINVSMVYRLYQIVEMVR